MRILALLSLLLAAPAAAHEFWIEPLDYQVDPDEQIVGHLVNGQEFAGVQLAYVPARFVNFVQVSADGDFARVESPVGTFPGLQVAPLGEGLAVIAYQSAIATVDYEELAKFASFAEHKDFAGWDEAHAARGLPETGILEIYSRFAKTLVAVGDGEGSDRRLGMETELVALDNPYTDPVADTGMRVQAFYRNDVRADAQIELFEKAPDGTVEITYHRTDDEGIATLPVKPGHSYLVDAVVLREPSQENKARGAHWETLWASLTFAVPG